MVVTEMENMIKYMPTIIAIILMVVSIAAGFFKVLTPSMVLTIVQLMIGSIIGHSVAVAQFYHAEYLERRPKR